VTVNQVAGSGVNVITGVGDSASLTINGSTSLAGQFTTGVLNANGALTVNTGDTLTVTSKALFQNSLTLDGTLTVDGTLSGVSNNFVLNGGTLTAGSLTPAANTFSLNSGATLSITGNATDNGTSVFTVNDSTFTVGGTFTTLGDQITVLGGGRVQLAELAGSVFLTVRDNTSSLEIGAAGGVAAGSLTVDNGITVTASGNFQAPNIVVDGTLGVAAKGNFTLDGSLGGNGQIQIGSVGNLTVENDQGQAAAATAPTITFLGSDDALTIFGNALNGTAFVPVLINLNGSDVIDYKGTATSATPGSFDGTNTVVTLFDNSTVVATLTLQGNYSNNTFITTQIGGGVTQIVDPPPPTVTTTSGGNSEISSSTVLSNNATGGITVGDPPANTSPPTSILDSLVTGDLPTHSSFGLNNALTTTGVHSGRSPPTSVPGLDHVVALFNQYMAAGFPEQHGGSITTNALSQVMANEQQFLANPHHG
jgi:hypothetical protein